MHNQYILEVEKNNLHQCSEPAGMFLGMVAVSCLLGGFICSDLMFNSLTRQLPASAERGQVQTHLV